jgi:Tol biopolymer transport system component/tRNA A-37 threonylcarbamoyl transferase component Bud32
MGEVYRARDTALNRDVAIKVLPAAVAADPERLTRFKREAQVLASLNHPNIAHVYGFEGAALPDGATAHFLAMELVEGEDLAERLRRGAIPVEEAIAMAKQIAEGLEEAHEHGIIHRDLEPANVKVTPDGKVKILDFGLAKALESDPTASAANSQLSHSPTMSRHATEAGMILGTAAYMSPEQARGKTVDKRADIWAFGVVSYEMLTGRQLFAGDTVSDVLASVLRQEIEWRALPPSVPAELRRLLARCLERNPKDRLHDIADARIAIDGLLRGADRDELPLVVAGKAPVSRRLAIGATCAGLALAALAGYWAARQAPGSAAAPPLRFERLTYRFGHFVNARFAPDGHTIFYAATWEGRPRELFQARPGSGGELSLGQPGADLLAVSRSGDLAILLPRLRGANPYRKWGTLALVPASGGTPRELAEDVVWADWAPDGQSLAVIRDAGGRRQLEYPLGTVLYRVPHAQLVWPRVSPDGEKVALFEREGGRYSVVVFDRNAARRAVSTGWADWWNLAWSPRGDEIWFGGARAGSASALHAVSLNGVERRLLEAPGTLEIHDVGPGGRALVASVRDRHQMFGREAGAPQERSLAWLELSTAIDLSDDGRRLLFAEQSEREGGKVGVYLRELDGAAAIRLGDGEPQDLSPDGRWALALRSGEIAALPTGAGVPRVRALPFAELAGARFLPDGDRIVLAAREGGGGLRLFITDFGAEPPRRFGPEIALRPAAAREPPPLTVSPDSRLLAFAEAAGGISVVPIEGGAPRRVPGVGVNDLPVQWSADGRRLLIFDPGEIPVRIFTLDLESGERRLVRKIEP